MTKHISRLELPIEVSPQELNQLSRDIQMAGVLQELALSLPAINDREQLMAHGASWAGTLLGAPQAAVLLVNVDGTALESGQSFDQDGSRGHGLRVPIGQGLIGSIGASGRPVLALDAPGEPGFDPTVDRIGDRPLASLLGVALRFRDEQFGALIIANRARPFNENDLRWLNALAAMLAAAYENICLIERLRAEQASLLETQEALRRKLARDLHDGATQQIAAAHMEVDFIRRLARHDPAQLERELDRLEELLARSMKMLRTALFDLRPLILEAEGLEAALQRFIREHSSERGPRLSLQVIGRLPQIRDQAGGALFAIIQEAVNNAKKHAGAQEVSISLVEAEDQLVVRIRDDGRGFNPQEVAAGYALGSSFGMRNMRELVDAIGGSLILWSEPGRGTSITITVPWANLNRPVA